MTELQYVFSYIVCMLQSKTSFGVPYLSPIPKVNNRSMTNSIFENPIWKKEHRPDFLKTKKNTEEPKISRNWKIKKNTR